MDIFYENWWWMLFIAVIILWLKQRKNRPETVLREKQISIKGQKILTPISKDSPLECLLSEGKIYGPDYKDKHPPQLPHTEGCHCRLIDLLTRTDDIFYIKKRETSPLQNTDIGELDKKQARYYKYRLIIDKSGENPELKISYLELSDAIKIEKEFKLRVDDHLMNRNINQ
ncbi:MAG: hypothetical protein OEY59_09505 [Deltaproteobacteria bacterium]|nr:hypothetical protein [Deltaproteobacteria bacterium]